MSTVSNMGNQTPVATNQTSSSTPNWLYNGLGNMASNFFGYALNGLSNKMFGDSAVGQSFGNALSTVGSLVGLSVISSLINDLNIGLNLKNINLSQQGYGLAGGLIGNAIGGDAGLAVGTAVSSVPAVTDAIKGIQTFNKAKNALKAGEAMSKAAKISQLGNYASLAGVAASVADSFLPEKTEYQGDKGKLARGLDTAYDAATVAANAIPVAGNLISALMTVNKFVGDGVNALGGGTDGMTTQDAILGSSFFNMTPTGLINGLLGKTSDSYEKNLQAWNLVGSAYKGSEGIANYASERSDKKYGAFSNPARKRANRGIYKANQLQGYVKRIADEDEKRDLINLTMSPYWLYNIYNQLNGGLDYYSLYAKLGAKLQRAKDTLKKAEWNPEEWETKKFNESEWEPVWNPEWSAVEEFKEGGKMNVIPEGSLHARLHHMDLEGITKKGIPVITEEDGRVIQHAEIELNEIVFTLEVTLKIEELMKDGSDKAAIEAGKLLASEIIDNTDDRTGLIQEINEN